MSTSHETKQILLNLLRDSRFCPFETCPSVNTKLLFFLARANKTEYTLLHFDTCPVCSKKISKSFKRMLHTIKQKEIVDPLMFESERTCLELILKRRHIRGVLFKHHNSRKRFGGDMDLLVSRKDIPIIRDEYAMRKYRISAKVAHKEIQAVNPKINYKLDIHHLIAYPHFGWLNKEEISMLAQYSSDLFLEENGKKYGIINMSPERYVVTRAIHYWYNDMLCSLYPLYEISIFCYERRHTLDWDKLFRIADAYSMRNEIIFIFFLSNKILDSEIPVEIKKKLSIRIVIAASALMPDDIIYFPSVCLWYHRRYRDIAQRKYKKYSIVKLLVSQNTPFTRLLRVRIILFVLNSSAKLGWDMLKNIWRSMA